MRKILFRKVSYCEIEVPDDLPTEKLSWWCNYGMMGRSPLTCAMLEDLDKLPPVHAGPWEVVSETPDHPALANAGKAVEEGYVAANACARDALPY